MRAFLGGFQPNFYCACANPLQFYFRFATCYTVITGMDCMLLDLPQFATFLLKTFPEHFNQKSVASQSGRTSITENLVSPNQRQHNPVPPSDTRPSIGAPKELETNKSDRVSAAAFYLSIVLTIICIFSVLLLLCLAGDIVKFHVLC